MTRNFQNKAIALSVLGLGLAAWTMAGRSLHREGRFNYAPNVLHLKGSPFGRTIAMAMQGPADVYFHQGEGHNHAPGAAPEDGCGECDRLKAKQAALESAMVASADPEISSGNELFVSIGAEEHVHTAECGHDIDANDAHVHAAHNHAPGEDCASCDEGEVAGHAVAGTGKKGIRATILDQIRDWRAVENSRTNPFSNSEAHKLFIRREIEKKLFLSYQMDPTNYAGYGAYFLFLNESSLGTQHDGRAQARKLAALTASHCMQEQHNPQALLTAAAASHDMISFLVEDQSSEAPGLAAQYATVTEHCLNQFEEIALQMVFDGTWERFSPARQNEMSERAHLLRALHEADRKMLRASASHAGRDEANRKSPTG